MDPPDVSRSPFGQLLATTRASRGLTQLELSLRAGVSVRHISFLESGRSRPSEFMIGCLAGALETEPEGEDCLRAAAGLLPRHPRQAATAPLNAAQTSIAVHVFDVTLRLNQATSSSELIELSRPLLGRLGIQYFFCGTVTPSAPIADAIAFDADGEFPTAWLRHYNERRYRPDDPLVRETLRTSRAFFWHDVTSRPQGLPQVERQIIDEAGDFGITGGFVVPLRRSDGSIRAVSMMGPADARDDSVRAALRIAGTCLLDAQERLGRKIRTPAVSPEGLDCLRWTLEKRSPRQIAEKLRLSPHVIRARLRAACLELGVRDPQQAVTRAIALGLIRGG